jgi:hypothetical protein
MKSLRIITILFTVTLLSILVGACNRDGGEPDKSPEGTYSIDPLFRKFYNDLGGEDVLGPAISPVFENSDSIYQYTIGALMKYETNAPGGEAYQLVALGREMGIYELPAQPTGDPDALYVDGHTIYKRFVPTYVRMGGQKVVGKPLTEVHKNILKNRYEQYFENVGFYWIEGDQPEAVYLLGYGAWKCDRYCRHNPPQNSLIQAPTKSVAPFVRVVALQGLDFTGFALSPPYITEEGRLEQIYENLVMSVNPGYPDTVSLLSITDKLEIAPDELSPAIPSPDMHFYAFQGNLGYNIPIFFMEYIDVHGGFAFIGEPLTQVSIQSDQSYRQCFSNLCLEGAPDGAGGVVVKPQPLGVEYRDHFYFPEQISDQPVTASDTTIQIWESFPMVSPGQEQEIGVAVLSDNKPYTGAQPVLEVTLPDGSSNVYRLPPTDQKGETYLIVPPVEAQNGTLIPYKVCLDTIGGQKFCIMDSYLIWQADYISITPTPPAQHISYLPFVMKNIRVYLPAMVNEVKTYLPFIGNND